MSDERTLSFSDEFSASANHQHVRRRHHHEPVAGFKLADVDSVWAALPDASGRT